MKFKGIAGRNHRNLKKGDPIELSPEEKACYVASEIVIDMSEDGWRNIPMSEELIGDITFRLGRKDLKNPEADQYIATVKVKYKRLHLEEDKLFSGSSTTLKIMFEDSIDDLGLPDFNVIKKEVVQ